MGNSPDFDHLILLNIRLILFGYAPIREHNTPQPGFDISAAKDGSRSEVEQDCYLFWGGTGTPGIFTLMAPRWLRLVK